MKETNWWLILILVLGGIVAFLYWQSLDQPEPPPPLRTEAPPPAKVEPQIRYPVQAPPQEPKPLPPLNDSDGTMQEALTEFFGRKSVAQYFIPKEIIRRFVVTVDSLPRKKVPTRYSLFKPAKGNLIVTGDQENLILKPENFERYTPYVLMSEAVDIKKIVAAYVRFYPLFQQEYKNLGYPSGYFNDRLVEAIDDMLAAPEISGPVRLIRPKVVYLFADPGLEALSAGKKIMIRMGSVNASRIKTKLREFRSELTGQLP